MNGVPKLLDILAEHNISASFFFSVGPDNMGRHLWRLLRPSFLIKMLRSGAPSLYGWDILLRGTFGPGPLIGLRARHIIERAVEEGHEVGFHAWDHHQWQVKSDQMDATSIIEDLKKGIEELSSLSGRKVECSAAAGWKCTELTLQQKEKFPMIYNSDCRGESIFRPVVEGSVLTPQVPVTLPTYDEVIGRNNVNDSNYNETLLELFYPNRLNVLTIHAEVEGMSRNSMFEDFLTLAKARRIFFIPLGDMLPKSEDIPLGTIVQGSLEGRVGTMCFQGSAA